MNKKQLEREVIERFRQEYPDFPRGKIVDFEEPDFLIGDSPNKIGIEVVEYVRGQGPQGSALRQLEVHRNQVVERATRIFEENIGVPLMVHCHWHSSKSLTRAEVDDLAND